LSLYKEQQVKRMKIEDPVEDNEEDNEEEEEEEEESEEESDYDYEDESMMFDDDATEHEYLKEDVAAAAKAWPKLEKDLGIPSVQIEPSLAAFDGECSVVLTFNISDLPGAVLMPNMEDAEGDAHCKLAWHLWDLGPANTVAVIVDGIHKGQFRTFQRRPEVLARINNDKPCKFPIGECLKNIVKPMITNTFSLTENLSPDMTGSFFSMLYEHMMERLGTMTQFCLVCGSWLHEGAILPSICEGGLCQYQYKELGLLEGLTNPRCSAPVLSLLLTAFGAASNSNRWRDILTPAPSPSDIDQLMDEAKALYKKIGMKWNFHEHRGYDVHSMLVRAMPCAHHILKTPAHYREFKKEMPSIAKFVEWLVISNESFVEIVPPNLKVDYLNTNRQFLFIADTPARQAEFDALKMQNGGKTRYLFHGSKKENWHSIIRSGLKNMSGTKYMTSGAAYGSGIYLSNLISTSFGYSSPFDLENEPQQCQKKKCSMSGMLLLAVVEVVDTPAAYTHNNTDGGGWAGSVVVVKEEKWCSIRMLVAYSGGSAPNIDLNAITNDARRQIEGLRSFTRPHTQV
ncbi:hypothetical protein PRIPAC_75538, partial [Pristionchus pacificus]